MQNGLIGDINHFLHLLHLVFVLVAIVLEAAEDMKRKNMMEWNMYVCRKNGATPLLIWQIC